MRTIKFRGLRSDGKGWVFGNLINYNPKFNPRIIWFDTRWDEETNFKVIPKSVGQFTGLQDKNGVDIYEGDIVKYVSRVTNIFTKSEIYFEGGCFCFGSLKCDIMFNELEIVGTIHENPELL